MILLMFELPQTTNNNIICFVFVHSVPDRSRGVKYSEVLAQLAFVLFWENLALSLAEIFNPRFK